MFGMNSLFLAGVSAGVVVSMVVVFLATSMRADDSLSVLRGSGVVGVGLVMVVTVLYSGPVFAHSWANLVLVIGGLVGCVISVAMEEPSADGQETQEEN